MRSAIRVLYIVFVLAPGVFAQLVDCRASPEGYKIFLDDVFSFSPSADPASQVLMNRLRAKLKSDFMALKAASPLPLSVVECNGRRPNNEDDFGSGLIDALNSRNVLLEVWGNIAPGDRNGTDTSIGFVLIPVRKSKDLAGVYTARYATQSGGSDQVLQLIRGAPEMKAFFDMASGVKASREQRYDEAYKCLCSAKLAVGNFRADGVRAERDSLAGYAQRLAAETVKNAIHDTAYSGALRLIDTGNAARICPANR